MSSYYLKILSGNHLGAEIPLEPGQYTLGTADNCDLILSDASLSETELVITIGDDGRFSVSTDNPQPLYLNGSPASQRLTPSSFDVITSSGVHIALGPADDSWPEIAIPELKKAEEQASAEGNNAENSDFHDPSHNNSDPSLSEKIGAEDTLDDDNEDTLSIDPKWFIALPALFLIIMTTFGFFLFSETETSQQKPTISPMDQANRIKSRLQLQDIKFRPLPDGTLLITGYTQTKEQKETLIQQLKAQRLTYRSQVIAMDTMRTNADALLKSRGFKHLTIESDNTPGSLILTGYVISPDQLDKVTATLKEEVYGLLSIVDQVENQESRLKTLKTMIKDKGLSSRVHLIERPGKILIQGLLVDEGQVHKLNQVANRFNTRYSNQPSAIVATNHAQVSQFNSPGQTTTSKTTAIVTSGQKRDLTPSITVRGVSMGTIPYVIMEDGGKYLIGAKLDNGYIIEDINLDYLLLSGSNSGHIKYLLGGKSSGKIKQQ